ncbi:unnamed protein product, partial [Amoebophrya sp. A120]
RRSFSTSWGRQVVESARLLFFRSYRCQETGSHPTARTAARPTIARKHRPSQRNQSRQSARACSRQSSRGVFCNCGPPSCRRRPLVIFPGASCSRPCRPTPAMTLRTQQEPPESL